MPELPNDIPPPSFGRTPPPPRVTSFATKGLIGSLIGAGVGFGTCGLAAVGGAGNSGANLLIPGGAILFFASLAAAFVFGIILIVQSARGSSRP